MVVCPHKKMVRKPRKFATTSEKEGEHDTRMMATFRTYRGEHDTRKMATFRTYRRSSMRFLLLATASIAWFLVVILQPVSTSPSIDDDNDDDFKVPPGFLLGAATSAYQSEGAWNVDGKGQSVFDYYFARNDGLVNGNVAADFYHRYEKDVGMASIDMGLNTIRLSLSWTRIFPTGKLSELNRAGVDHYHRVLDTILAANMTPVVSSPDHCSQ